MRASWWSTFADCAFARIGREGDGVRRELPMLIGWAIAVGVPAAALLALRGSPPLDSELTFSSPTAHFYIVSAVSLVAVGLGVVSIAAAFRVSSDRVFVIALGFLGLAGIFAVHGLGTPGFIVDQRFFGVTGFSSRLALLVGVTMIAASALSTDRTPLRSWRLTQSWRATILIAWAGALAVYAIVALNSPETLPPALLTHRLYQDGGTLAVVTMSGFAGAAYARRYARSRLPVYATTAVGVLLIGQAQIALHFGSVWSGTFWLYHVQLLLGFSAITWGVILEYARGAGPVHAFGRLGAVDAFDQIRAGYADSIVALAAALEARDGYTLGHGERVAALSVLMDEQMRLSPALLRGLGQGALLHDVGKIGIADSLLHKPGPLTSEEFQVVQEHPSRGEAMISATSSGDVERNVIHHHHERWDGGGYPARLAAETIPVEARIAAVADVYDALRSARSYRTAWDREQALAYVRDESGRHFDPRCVEAFLAVVDAWERRYARDDAPYEARRAA